ncbi:MAG: phosphatidylglycerophosphatase A [Erysipelotrichaceae bacterium]|nr:phosphatidylglycerophosphatase A [Erysipelotrichaceae bacterium]
MKHLKCLDNFINSKSNYYNEEQMQLISISMLKERGVEIDDIAFLSYYAQCKYLPNLTLDECKKAVLEILKKRETFHAILFAINVDICAEKHMFDEPLNAIILSDVGLFSIDETLALSICGDYGSIGKTNFGNLDINKPAKVYQLQNNKEHCHCFLDDIISAIAANSAIKIAQLHANNSINE